MRGQRRTGMTLRQIIGGLPRIPLLMTLAALLVLLSLGVWQLQRLQWKNALIAEMEAQMALPAVPLPLGHLNVEEWRYRKATVTGRFHHDKEIHLYAPSSKGLPGYQIITPLERSDGSYVMFNRGWAPMEMRNPDKRPEGQIEGIVTVTGLGRAPWPRNTFVAENAPEKNIWFYGDLEGMAKFLQLRHYAPLFLEADASPNPGGWPLGGQSRVKISNDHLSYALTWFSLAAALIVVFIFFAAEHFRAES